MPMSSERSFIFTTSSSAFAHKGWDSDDCKVSATFKGEVEGESISVSMTLQKYDAKQIMQGIAKVYGYECVEKVEDDEG